MPELDFDFEGHLLDALNMIPGVAIVEIMPEEMPTAEVVSSMLTEAVPVAELATI